MSETPMPPRRRAPGPPPPPEPSPSRRWTDTRPPDRMWTFAWILLVVTVALGFFIQSRTIESLHDTQDDLRTVVMLLQANDKLEQEQLCDLLLTIAEEIERPTGIDLTQEIQRSFERVGIGCRGKVQA